MSYPIIAFLGLLLLGALLALVAGIFLPPYAGLPLAAGVLVGTIYLGRWLDDRFRSFWLLRVYGAMQPWAYGKMPELDERIREFADHIVERIRGSDTDEILVVGHSRAANSVGNRMQPCEAA